MLYVYICHLRSVCVKIVVYVRAMSFLNHLFLSDLNLTLPFPPKLNRCKCSPLFTANYRNFLQTERITG